MLLSLNFESDVPIYLQLRIQIIEGIASGELKPGEALPSVRQLAADLGINLHTVNKAYNFLKQDGFILVHRQKGVVVNPGDMPGVTEDYLEQLRSSLHPLVAEAFCRGMGSRELEDICKELFSALENKGGSSQ